METLFLIGVSFLTSTLTATIGLGGGVLLIAVMPGLLPAVAIEPVHGAVQLASNASRVLLGAGHLDWPILRPFAAGAVLGAAAGAPAVSAFDFSRLPLYLGVFIILVTWLPGPPATGRLPGRFFLLGATQAWLSLFVGATGPFTRPLLLGEGLPRDRLVVTLGGAMTIIHVVKLVVFGLAGFAFGPYLGLTAGMVAAVVVGSWVGTRLRRHVPEAPLRRGLRIVLTVLAVRMIVDVAIG